MNIQGFKPEPIAIPVAAGPSGMDLQLSASGCGLADALDSARCYPSCAADGASHSVDPKAAARQLDSDRLIASLANSEIQPDELQMVRPAHAARARILTLTRILTGTLTLALALTTHYTRPRPDQVRPSPRGLPGRQLPTAADERRHVPRPAASASARRHQLPRRRRCRRRATYRLRAGLRVRRRVRTGRGARRFAASPSP